MITAEMRNIMNQEKTQLIFDSLLKDIKSLYKDLGVLRKELEDLRLILNRRLQ
jgi:predicted membrane-bound spermidine synthase